MGSVSSAGYGLDASEDVERYRSWLAAGRGRSAERRAAVAAELERRSPLPRLALIGLTPGDFRRTLGSLRAQIHPRWTAALPVASLRERMAVAWRRDPRLHGVAVPRGEPTWRVLSRALDEVEAEYVGFLEPGCALSPDAAGEVVLSLAEEPADVLYTDEDRIGSDGGREAPRLKPDWSPETFASWPYVGNLVVVRRSRLLDLGGFRSGVEGAEIYDLLLRIEDAGGTFRHLPQILHHATASGGSPASSEGRAAALRDRLERRAIDGVVGPAILPGRYRVRRRIAGHPRVAVIVPFRDRVSLLERCVASLRERPAGYEPWELLLVDNGSEERETADYLRRLEGDPRIRMHRDPSPFHWAAINNRAVRLTDAERLLFLNSDVEARSREWLLALLEVVEDPAVAAVGARLLYPDGSVQHAALALGLDGGAGHVFRRCPGEASGYLGLAKTTRNVTAVTGACLMARRDAFDELGGFDERFARSFNDVDFCLRAIDAGYRIVYSPHCEMLHHESATRGFAHDAEGLAAFLGRWGSRLGADPYFHPALDRSRPECALPDGSEIG